MARPLPGGDCTQRAVPGARCGAADQCHAADRRGIWYQLYFQEPGVAEAEYDRNVRPVFHAGRIGISGDAPPGTRAFGMVPRRGSPFRWNVEPPPLPAWLSEADIDFYVAEFTRTGFRGGFNSYRNIDRNWELLAPFDGMPVTVPALYIAGDRDPVIKFPGMDRHIADMAKFVPPLRRSTMLPGCGHITQEERPRSTPQSSTSCTACRVDRLQRGVSRNGGEWSGCSMIAASLDPPWG